MLCFLILMNYIYKVRQTLLVEHNFYRHKRGKKSAREKSNLDNESFKEVELKLRLYG